MKDEILKILSETISIIQSGYMNGNADLEGISDAADELQTFMCYREVRAFTHGRSVYLNVPNLLVALFKEFYSKELILEAIEKVKNEQNAG